MASKIKTLYDQGKALMAPVTPETEAIAEKQANINQYSDATAPKPTLVISPPAKTSPKDMLNGGPYGTQPGEQRIDTSSYMKPLGGEPVSYHAEGGKLDPNKINVVGENGPEEIIGDEVVPLDHTMPKGRSTAPEDDTEGAPADFSGPVFPNPNHMKAKWDTEKPDIDQKAPMNMDNAKPEDQSAGKPSMLQQASMKPSPAIPKPVTSPRAEDARAYVMGAPGTASPEARDEALNGPVVKESSKAPMVPNDNMVSKSPAPQQEQPAAPPDPNQVIADQHAKAMKAKLDAASKGDFVGMGSAIIAGNALPKPIPSPAEGGVVPGVNLGPGGTNMPEYTGKARIGAGTPGEEQAKKDYQDKLNDLDQRILTASRIHTPEGKQELGYLQSEKAVLQKMNPLGSAANKPGVLGKIEHGLGVVGNVAGDALIPNVMPNIPGSQANLEKQNEEGVANVEQGNQEALREAQANKANQTPAVKPQDQLAQEKLDAQTKLGQITQQLQDPNVTPEQKAALQQQAEQIYSGNPEFRPKPEDQTKQPVGDAGVAQHAQQLDAIAQAAGFTPEQTAAQQQAYGVKPGDSQAVADKKLAEADSTAKLDSARRDRKTAQDAAATLREDTKADKEDVANKARNDKSFQYNQTRLDKIRKPIDDISMRMGRLKQTVAQNTPLADSLVAPELLTAMAGGQGSGLRMNEAEISRIVGGRGHWADLQAAVNKWAIDPKAALSITPEQRREIHALLNVATQRVSRETSIIDDATAAMTQAETPEEHRKIIAKAQGALGRAEIGKVQVQVPGQEPGVIELDKLGAFKQKYPDATVE